MADLEYYREAERLAKEALDYEGLPSNHHVQIGQLAQVYALLNLADAVRELDTSGEFEEIKRAIDWGNEHR